MTHNDLFSIRESLDILEAAEILSEPNERVYIPINYASQSRELPYLDYWELHKRNFWYHARLSDDSLLLFESDSFRFIMSPISIPSQEEYFLSELGDDWTHLDEETKHAFLASGDFKSEYNLFLESVSDFKSFTPVRLDQHPKQYKALSHPAHHLHIGYENESRIPVKRVLTPLAFTAFIISTFYPKGWEKLYSNEYFADEKIDSLKVRLDLVAHINQDFWSDEHDEKRLYLV